MGVCLAQVQRMLDEHRDVGRRKSWWVCAVRAYLSGRKGCHDKRAPWKAWKAYQWNWYKCANIWEMNQMVENVLGLLRFPDIHFLPIDRPALPRPDAQVASDCLHIMAGAGVLEGWTHQIWQFVSRELTGRIRWDLLPFFPPISTSTLMVKYSVVGAFLRYDGQLASSLRYQ
ncbi:hypothetical protein WOLCODRAFT_140124 [Wolfiporia cocos MD-104 SS10]|uniref:Uncharacterized protein n=1 Tax=Wolfiporia cocos (strain MD-104) TaxID=742152 RepID=A0A2H3JIT3_WOLCO|nr:hypothetical protein WOLCODRAFT_140124 [Wolfiporia cocos MD-104 SS10]